MANIAEDFTTSAELNEKLCFGKAWPVPRLSTGNTNEEDTYDVIVVGAGPAELLLTLKLAHLSLNNDSLLCIDAKVEGTKTGHADGVNARSQEILRTLGLEGDILREGNPFSEMAFWARSSKDSARIERKMRRVFENPNAVRFDQPRTVHQGRIERIFKSDLQKYSARGVQYSTSIKKVWLDDASSDYPVLATLEHAGSTKTIRSKYLVGADGAHSVVRKCMNIEMEGDITDTVWGVIDFVADTNFPDIRRPTNFEGLGSGRGDGLIVPRERLSDGSYTTRLYIDMTEYDDDDGKAVEGGQETAPANAFLVVKTASKMKKAEITADAILKKGAKLMSQYRFRMREGSQPFWWAVYSVGQRLAYKFVVNDSGGTPRIFLVGDACHTHSPRQGQGMNISMQDSHDLAWKLAYVISGLTPTPSQLLQTYESERRPAASKVVFFDKRWNQSDMSREQKLKEAKDQILCCGVEYDPNLVIAEKAERDGGNGERYPVSGTNYMNGVPRTGRRLLNVRVRRFADSTMWDIQDDLLANGRYRVAVICGDDFPDSQGRSLPAVASICGKVVKEFPVGMVEAIILQPDVDPSWEFDDLPACIKNEAEMRLYCASQEVYDTYGVDVKRGALVLVRPDGMVGMIASLEQVILLERFLQQVLVMA